ncbi:type II toxin-antitoxin system HicA family toxin [Patescibacteria group bacterium]|nr:type II toxin-antitoxin system HicA family toxin [Patescibacteria group bacterium]
MVKLANISGREAVKAFVKAGYTHARTSGDHAILTKPSFHTLSIPLYKEVKPFLLKAQIKRGKMTYEEFLELLKK